MALDPRWIVETTRDKVNDQFPGMAMLCFPGSVADQPVRYETLDAMWRVLDVYCTNKTAATEGAQFSTTVMPAFDQPSLRFFSSFGGLCINWSCITLFVHGFVINVSPTLATYVFV